MCLVIGAETVSRIIDWKDRNTSVIFGDGAGAVILQASETQGILSSHIHADGQYADLLNVPAGISSDYDMVKADKAFVTMQGNEVFKVAVNTLGRIVDETLAANSMKKEDIDWLVPHQANMRIISATAKKLDMSMDRVIVTVDQHGNTSAASVPLALDVAVRDGRIKAGDTVLLKHLVVVLPGVLSCYVINVFMVLSFKTIKMNSSSTCVSFQVKVLTVCRHDGIGCLNKSLR